MEESVPQIRKLDPARDLRGVADLIELCFGEGMDPDGREYLRNLRFFATQLSNPFTSHSESYRRAARIQGLVWEEEGAIIGNLTLIPFIRPPQSIYLIANVATHPAHRRQGIARKLTQRALEVIKEYKVVKETWLQVREENLPALLLYQSLGFSEIARRATWEMRPRDSKVFELEIGFSLSRRLNSEWHLQKELLGIYYPPELEWNMGYHLDRWLPGLWPALRRFWKEEDVNHRCLKRKGSTIGFITRESTHFNADTIWLAARPDFESQVIRHLIPSMCQAVPSWRPLALNYPAGRAVDELQAVGMHHHQTLIWMRQI